MFIIYKNLSSGIITQYWIIKNSQIKFISLDYRKCQLTLEGFFKISVHQLKKKIVSNKTYIFGERNVYCLPKISLQDVKELVLEL